MKKSLFICILIVLATLTCCERKFNNPVDPDLIDDNLLPPDSLQIRVVDEDILELTWVDKCKIEDSFQIFRKTGTGNFAHVKTLPANSSSWQDENISLGKVYTYQIYAVNDNYKSPKSTESSFNYSLYPPTNLQIEALAENRIKLSWEASNHFAEGYKIDTKLKSGVWQENFASVAPEIRTWEYNPVAADSLITAWRVKAYYKSLNSSNSNEVSLKVADPIFSQEAGTYYDSFALTISCATQGAQIRYTTDGSTPTNSSTLYTAAIQVNVNTTLKAKAFKSGWTDSGMANASYILKVATPTFNPAGGIYATSQNVSISCATPGATIRYTTDGSTPTGFSSLYSAAIQVSVNTSIKAKAFKSGWTDSEVANSNYVFMAYVQGGTFHNGTSNVTLSSFYISKYETTQSEYQAVMGNNPASGYGVGGSYPVYYVSWFNAIEYCNRRSIKEGITPCYSYGSYGTNPSSWPSGWNTSDGNHTNVSCNWTANGYRLPTEMEWMYAAKGGNQSQGYTYSGSNDINAVAWYSSNSGSTTHAVGTKLPNELGIYDMSGNVWEWCWDIFGYYPSVAQTNPHGATSGSDRVRRGGSWGASAGLCTVSIRFKDNATYSFGGLGFRCVRVSP